MKDFRVILHMRAAAILLLFTLTLIGSSPVLAQETPLPFKEAFDLAVKERGLPAAAKLLIFTAIQKGQLEVAPVIGAKPDSPERMVVQNLLQGLTVFTILIKDGEAHTLFGVSGKALPSITELTTARKHYMDALERLETDTRQDNNYMEAFPKKDTQIVELLLLRDPRSRAPGDVRIFLFFKKVKEDAGDAWRLAYGFGLVTKPLNSQPPPGGFFVHFS